MGWRLTAIHERPPMTDEIAALPSAVMPGHSPKDQAAVVQRLPAVKPDAAPAAAEMPAKV
jgi:hypothetical protein